jgi:tRNA A22 N-methylase
MGGDTMIHILESAPWLCNERYRMVLQCQTKSHMLRRYLSQTGWFVRDEAVLRDGKFLYTVMDVIWKPGFPLSAGEWYFPPAIYLHHAGPDAAAYYRYIAKGLRVKVEGQGVNADPKLKEALAELESLVRNPDLNWLKEEKA